MLNKCYKETEKPLRDSALGKILAKAVSIMSDPKVYNPKERIN
jgi:hypothetical protein